MTEELPPMTPDEFLPWAAKRIEMHERLLLREMGRNRALRHALSAIIVSHPNVSQLRAVWRQMLPDIVDEEMQIPLHDTEDFRKAMHQTLASLSQIVEIDASDEPTG